jgi:hypothetical protein
MPLRNHTFPSRSKPFSRVEASCDWYYEKFADFKNAVLTFLREEVPRKWHVYCDTVTDNFRVIDPKNFRILA